MAKSIVNFFKNALLCFLALFLVGAIFCFIISHQYTNYSTQDQSAAISRYTQSEASDFIYTDESRQAHRAIKKINQFIQSQPSSLTEDFLNEWKVIIAKDVTLDYSESTAGLTVWQSRLVLLNTYDDSYIVYGTFIHEFGHYFDMSHGFCSKSPKFQTLYAKYKDIYCEQDQFIPASYTSSTAQEFFASIFKEYYLYPEHLKALAPEGYEFIDSVINDATTHSSWQYDVKNNVMGYYRSLKK